MPNGHRAINGFTRAARKTAWPSFATPAGLSDRPDQSCAEVDAIARAQLQAVEGRIARLQALKGELERMVGHCAGGTISDCRVIEVLGNHAHCAADHGRDFHAVSE